MTYFLLVRAEFLKFHYSFDEYTICEEVIQTQEKRGKTGEKEGFESRETGKNTVKRGIQM